MEKIIISIIRKIYYRVQKVQMLIVLKTYDLVPSEGCRLKASMPERELQKKGLKKNEAATCKGWDGSVKGSGKGINQACIQVTAFTWLTCFGASVGPAHNRSTPSERVHAGGQSTDQRIFAACNSLLLYWKMR